jgi:NTP pyrophosphatase (non-canonical NTP hydrolase)
MAKQEDMTFKEYQKLAHTTSLNTTVGGSGFVYPVLGLTNEAGEVAGKTKKLFRDKAGLIDEESREQMVGELGDVLWYLAECCTQLGIDFERVASSNLTKLFDRKERGKIQGSGDKR